MARSRSQGPAGSQARRRKSAHKEKKGNKDSSKNKVKKESKEGFAYDTPKPMIDHHILGVTVERLFMGLSPEQKDKPSTFLPLFHSLLIMALTSGMVSAILVVDIIFDLPVAAYQLSGIGPFSPQTPTDVPFHRAFIYYNSILNSPLMTFKTLGAMTSVLYGSWLAWDAGAAVNELNPARYGKKFPLALRFQIIFVTYCVMTAVYLLFIIPRYLPFMRNIQKYVFFNDEPLEFDVGIFDNWWYVSLLRIILFSGNIAAIVQCIQVMRKLVRAIEPDVRI